MGQTQPCSVPFSGMTKCARYPMARGDAPAQGRANEGLVAITRGAGGILSGRRQLVRLGVSSLSPVPRLCPA